jgi:hypothetical protein
MSFVPATLAIDPAAFLSTIFAAVAAGLTWGATRHIVANGTRPVLMAH